VIAISVQRCITGAGRRRLPILFTVEIGSTIEQQPEVRLSLRPAAPFDFALTARVLRRSTRNVVARVDEHTTWSRVVVPPRVPITLGERRRVTERGFRYIVVGGGLTAASAVKGIRELDPDGTLLMLAAEHHPPYHRPPLSKGLWLGKNPGGELALILGFAGRRSPLRST